MASNTPTPQPDHTTQILTIAAGFVTLMSSLVPKILNRTRKKRKSSTDELDAVQILDRRDKEIDRLEKLEKEARSIAEERGEELRAAEKHVQLLTLRVNELENEVTTLRALQGDDSKPIKPPEM